jgi:hypothetical protein
MLHGRNEFKTDGRHHGRISVQSADVESDLYETDGHKDSGSEQRHPTRKALRRARQVNKCESKKHD